MNIDVKDRRLLFEIDFNARKTYTELAKILKMSKRGVEYKLKNLEKKGIIIDYATIIDISTFGFNYYRVFIEFQNLNSKLKKEIEDYIKKENKIGWAIWTYGIYNIGFTIWARTVTEFKETINKFYFTFGRFIKERTESIATEVQFYKNRFLIDKSFDDKLIIKESGQEIKFDELDIKIVNELISYPRTKIIDLANKLKETTNKINYRVKKLQTEKVILGIRPILNYQLLNKTYYKLFINLNNTNKEQTKELENYVSNNKSVTYIVKALGTCDFDIELIVNNNEELFEFINNIQEKFPNSIKDYKTLILTKTIKANFFPEITPSSQEKS